MNFANVKEITIPEGSVKQIASGQTILWKKESVIVTLTKVYTYQYNYNTSTRQNALTLYPNQLPYSNSRVNVRLNEGSLDNLNGGNIFVGQSTSGNQWYGFAEVHLRIQGASGKKFKFIFKDWGQGGSYHTSGVDTKIGNNTKVALESSGSGTYMDGFWYGSTHTSPYEINNYEHNCPSDDFNVIVYLYSSYYEGNNYLCGNVGVIVE